MPPKASAAVAAPAPPPPASPTPPPGATNAGGSDEQDLLVIQDLMDTLEQIPAEMTRVHSDLNELGAVLYSTLQELEKKLNQLIEWIPDPNIKPAQRFQLLQEIAEEAARYKLGGDDKIRVAGGACDGIIAHQKHITNLLEASTLLIPAPPSPYTSALTLSSMPVVGLSRRQIARANAASPFPSRGPGGGGPGAGGAGEGRTGDTPTKKKKVSRVQQLGKEDDDASSSGGRERKAPAKKKRARAHSPTDSIASASAFAGTKPSEPRTARQLAAAQNKARQAERMSESSDSDGEGGRERKRPFGALGQGMQPTPSTDSMARDGNGNGTGIGLGLDVAGGHSRESTGRGSGAGKSRGGGAGRGKRRREDGEEGSSDEEEGAGVGSGAGIGGLAGVAAPPGVGLGLAGVPGVPGPGGPGVGGGKRAVVGGFGPGAMSDGEAGGDGDADGAVYCTCRQVSYGEMIGCDDDECAYEWFHIACLGFSTPPEGNWICPDCVERRKRNPKAKKPVKAKVRR